MAAPVSRMRRTGSPIIDSSTTRDPNWPNFEWRSPRRASPTVRARVEGQVAGLVHMIGTGPCVARVAGLSAGPATLRSGLCEVETGAPRPGCLSSLPVSSLDLALRKTLREHPPDVTHWPTRTLAQATGLSASIVRRIWRSHRLQLHRVRSFKVSKDEHYVREIHDAVDLYLNPPQPAVVLSDEEKIQIPALDRTQTTLPLRSGLPETRTHDYQRNGHIDLFAALNTLSGTVVTEFHVRHRNREFRLFLDTLDRTVPEEFEVHLIPDKRGVRKHPDVKRGLRRHPRFHFHFVPTSSSSMNPVERGFKRLTDTRIRRGTFRSVPALKAAIDELVATYYGDPRPSAWTAAPEKIIGR